MAIRAHLEIAPAADDKRTAPRRALHLETSGFAAAAGADDGCAETNVTIHNISEAGLLIETALDLATGEVLAIDLPQAGVVGAGVVWRSAQLYGCAFETRLNAAALAAAQLQGFAPGGPTHPVAAAPVAARGSSEALGPQLNRLRREAGLTLADVAAMLKVSKPTVWAWEKGKAKPLPERLAAIAAALGVDPEMLAPPSRLPRESEGVIAECRARIAEACGTGPDAVRIMIEL
jgi:transcriptional regulator with XRE-family HTH domain